MQTRKDSHAHAERFICVPMHAQVPHGAAGLFLLGRVYKLVGRMADAKVQFVRAVRVNPLLWCAFEELCGIGEWRQWRTLANAGLYSTCIRVGLGLGLSPVCVGFALCVLVRACVPVLKGCHSRVLNHHEQCEHGFA